MTNPSNAPAMLAAEIRLFTSFIICAKPGAWPTTKTLPAMMSRKGRTASTADGSPATIAASVPSLAPRGPPLTGTSTNCLPASANAAATGSMACLPMVAISTKMRRRSPWTAPSSPIATDLAIAAVGRQEKMISTRLAMSAGVKQALAPLCVNLTIAAGSASRTNRSTPASSKRAAIAAAHRAEADEPGRECAHGDLHEGPGFSERSGWRSRRRGRWPRNACGRSPAW